MEYLKVVFEWAVCKITKTLHIKIRLLIFPCDINIQKYSWCVAWLGIRNILCIEDVSEILVLEGHSISWSMKDSQQHMCNNILMGGFCYHMLTFKHVRETTYPTPTETVLFCSCCCCCRDFKWFKSAVALTLVFTELDWIHCSYLELVLVWLALVPLLDSVCVLEPSVPAVPSVSSP